jgi:hypothetical protein
VNRKTPAYKVLVFTVLLLLAALGGDQSAEGRSDSVAQDGSLVVRILGRGAVNSVDSGAVVCSRSCRVRLPLGTELGLEARPAEGNYLSAWRGSCSGSGDHCDVVIGKATPIIVLFRRGRAPLPELHAVKLTIGGAGTVTSDPAGLDCPVHLCTSPPRTRGTIRLEPAAQQDSIFQEWRGKRCKGAGSCVVSLTRDASLQAVFRPRVIPGESAVLKLNVPKSDLYHARVRVEATGYKRWYCASLCIRRLRSGTALTLTWLVDVDPPPVEWTGDCQGDSETCVLILTDTQSVTLAYSGTALNTTGVALNVTRSGAGFVESVPSGIACGSGHECSAAFPKATEVTLSATGTGRYEFDHWGGECTHAECVLTLRRDSTNVSAIFRLKHHTVSVSTSGDGSGTVTSDPEGINCPTKCSASFTDATHVTLYAKKEADSRFVGWGGDCSGRERCEWNLTKDTAVTAQFDRLRDKVRVKKSGDGHGRITSQPAGINCGDTCAAQFARGTRVGLHATPATDSRFDGWSGACTGADPCAIDVRKQTLVGARFLLIHDEIRVDMLGHGEGRVESTPQGIACGTSCTASFTRGTVITLRAKPKVGSRFAGWVGACSGTGNCLLTLRRDAHVWARFARICVARTASTFSARVASNPRRVVVRIRLDGTVSGRVRLLRARREIAEKSVTLKRGSRRLILSVPRAAPRGTYGVTLLLKDSCGRARRFHATVKLPGA